MLKRELKTFLGRREPAGVRAKLSPDLWLASVACDRPSVFAAAMLTLRVAMRYHKHQ